MGSLGLYANHGREAGSRSDSSQPFDLAQMKQLLRKTMRNRNFGSVGLQAANAGTVASINATRRTREGLQWQPPEGHQNMSGARPRMAMGN